MLRGSVERRGEVLRVVIKLELAERIFKKGGNQARHEGNSGQLLVCQQVL